MKSIITKTLVLVLIITSVFVVTACDKEKKDNDKKDTKSSKIVGSWEHTGYTYTFNSDKTCSYKYGETEMNCTYEDDGEKVSILYDGNTVASEYEYKVEGSKLTIKDSFGDDVVYTKK